MDRKTLSYLGFARKAGQLVTGMGTCEIQLKKGRVRLLLFAEDMAAGSLEKAIALAKRYGVPYVIAGTGEELSQSTGTAGRYVFGVTDAHFAGVIASSIEKEEQTAVK
ncbi:MAG: ribosomal L7Ae/L30e/S12e/Gadd45 family protein [Clostridiales bacterium]|nr:ribosomal L7Ae/L30e/S12e/Gadd45 family protein [Clostridiales bacterium]